eukprot:CAMPEP_0118662724 /NCGR_PEP_ID=MMETSP0785-20121206/16994_1 /TAXON_ID=91992 /ORGANISM="Bolidomonas pacifica, Strain CCMP 1866" /LENGTH=527 /DNA_ID=CAMNT_0006556307 /DNA_START=203 /DNA_END=1783 /DNA_ORIENTATION=-
MESSLQSLIHDSQIRNQVQSVLSTMLYDLESEKVYNDNLRTAIRIKALERENDMLRKANREYVGVERKRRKERVKGGVGLCKDLFRLSLEYNRMSGELMVHSESSKKVNVMARQLRDSEERCRALERRASNSRNANVDITTGAGSAVMQPPQQQPAIQEAIQPVSKPKTPTQPSNHNLNKLDDPSLFTVFGFLDPNEVLSVAQVDKTFFKRVDELFGIGSSVNSNDEDTPPPTPSAPQSTQSNPTPTNPIPPNPNLTPTRQSNSVAAAAAANSLISKGLSFLGRTTTANAPATENSTIGANANNDVGNGSYPPDATKTPANQLHSTSDVNKKPPGSNGGTVNTALFASSIADKLSASELKSIISLTEKLKSSSLLCSHLKSERDDYMVRLEGSERVREFLVKKRKEEEDRRAKEEVERVGKEKQTKADQEVIGFLDARVRSLEKANTTLESSLASSTSALARLKTEKTKQLKVLEDMLQFERLNVSNLESTHKHAKKVLVKEVKGCRAEITALKAERDGLKGELGIL